MTNPIHTFQTRVNIGEKEHEALSACAALLSKVEHSLFAALMARRSTIGQLKSDFIRRFGITARQFNACRIQVEGKISSLKQLQSTQIADLKLAITKIEASIAKIKKKKINALKVFLKKRKVNGLKQKLAKLQKDQEEEIVHLCFGTKKLFKEQFHLQESGHSTFNEWKDKWKKTRASEFFIVGSKDETCGNQTCSASIQENGKLTFRLRLPHALHEKFGKYITISDVEFAYGHEAIVANLEDCLERNKLQKNKNSSYKMYGQAISYRFKLDEKGWRIFASTSLHSPECKTSNNNGVIGVDINVDHLAIAETDRHGNPISAINIPLVLYGKDSNQSLACIGDACAKVIDFALQKKKDIVIEDLDFQKKKADLSERFPAHLARTLSSFSYAKIIQCIKSRSFRYGVCIHQVNPAYTSIIGRVKFAKRYGLSIHQAAALCIGRRFKGFSERLSCYQDKVPDGKGGHVAFSLPARNDRNHVWSQWRKVKKKFQAVLAAHFLALKKRSMGSLKCQPMRQ